MAFLKKLETLLSQAIDNGIIDPAAKAGIVALAREEDKGKGVLSLSGALGLLGAFAVVMGVILLISHNWQNFGNMAKLGGFLLLLAGVHGMAFYIRLREPSRVKCIESLHFIGAGLFLSGIGLIAQLYHLSSDSGMAYLIWFVAIAPLAVSLRSAGIVLMALLALLMFVHINGVYPASPFYMPMEPTAHLALEMALGVGLICFSLFAPDREYSLLRHLFLPGCIMVSGSLYVAGFYHEYTRNAAVSGSYAYPLLAMALGIAGVVYGAYTAKRRYVHFLAGMTAVLGLCALLLFSLSAEKISQDSAFIIAVIAWGLWFWLAFLCIGYGSLTHRKGYVNFGVIAVGLGVMTRFFDLVGTMLQTGTVFILGGVVLLLLGWGLEKWRRAIIAHWGRNQHAL